MSAPPTERVVIPPREEHGRLPQQLTSGEAEVFEFLDQTLDAGWEIYLQPHLNGLRPDIVLLHPRRGVAVIEVKDWNLKAREYRSQRTTRGWELFSRAHGEESWHPTRNPLDQVRAARQEIVDLYLPGFSATRRDEEAGQTLALVSAVVVFTRSDDDDVRATFEPFLPGLHPRYERLVGRQALQSSDARALFSDSGREQSRLMSDEIAAGLRQWLDEPSFCREQRDPLPLDSRQRTLASERTPTGYRRLRGPAGSGKTCVVAARASNLALEGKKVLVVTFNLTLLNYIRDLAVRWPHPGALAAAPGSIDYLNFHYWCKRVSRQDGREAEYRKLWQRAFDEGGQEEKLAVEEVLSEGIARLVEATLKDSLRPQDSYDAILVDEGQDFRLAWWQALRRALRPGGEMLLVADATQDVYGTSRNWTDEAMRSAGFGGGPWATLDVSYRLPRAAVAVARAFAEEFLPVDMRLLPQRGGQQELDVEPCQLRWVAVAEDQLSGAIRREVDAMLVASRAAEEGAGLHPIDVVLITDGILLGRAVTQALRSDGLRVTDTYAKDSRRARAQKLWFFKGDARVKATTIHSFKGWESRALVVGISRCGSANARALVYTALTRLRNDPRGSYLTVVSAADELTAFGRTWPDFVGVAA